MRKRTVIENFCFYKSIVMWGGQYLFHKVKPTAKKKCMCNYNTLIDPEKNI